MRTTTPNHADETQPAQHSKAEGARGGTSPATTALRPCGGGPGMLLPATPLWGALGRHPSLTGTTKRGASEVRAPMPCGITLRSVYAFRDRPF